MLPHVDHQDRQRAPADVVLVIVDLLDQEPAAERIPRQYAPARTLERHANGVELHLERRERAEVPLDLVGQNVIGGAASVGRQVAPEQRMQHVTGEVEREIALELRDRIVASAATGFGEVVDRLVRALHVTRVVRVVVQVDHLAR